MAPAAAGERVSFDSTYEGLKLDEDGYEETVSRSFDSTYEGLKLVTPPLCLWPGPAFRQYL